MKIEQVWQEYRSNLKAFIHSKVANPQDAEDLLQDILIKSQNGLAKVQSQGSVKSWLFQIANRTIIDYYRRSARLDDFHPDDLWYQEPEKDVQQQLAECIKPFIDALPEASSALLREIDINGIGQKEYAEQLGLPYSTLKSQVKKSRQELKKLFDSCCTFSLDSQGNVADFHPKECADKPDYFKKC